MIKYPFAIFQTHAVWKLRQLFLQFFKLKIYNLHMKGPNGHLETSNSLKSITRKI